MRPIKKKITFICTMMLALSLYAEEDPCQGEAMLLNVINRPSFSNSACTVPPKKAVTEGGFQSQQLIGGGTQTNVPELNVRFGFSKNSEFFIAPPNYIYQTIDPLSGTTPTTFGIKHRIYFNSNWIITGEGELTPSSGSRAFGSPHLGGAINGILYHQINKAFSCQLQLGINALSEPAILGGQEYRSFNPNFLINYTFKDKISSYLEFFGQSKTSATDSFGLIGGTGIVYLFNSKTTFDIEYYQRITGSLLGFEHFVGVGLTRSC